MNRADLIAALQDECRIDRLRIEDFLAALSDLCAEALRKGQRITIGSIGTLSILNGAKKKAIKFGASVEFRESVGLPEKYDGPLCADCKKNPRAPRRRDCHTCKKRKERVKESARGSVG